MEYSLVEMIEAYLLDKMFVVVVVLWIIGIFLKRTPFVRDWTIIWILLGVGVTISFFMLGFSVSAFIQGILTTGFAVFGHQIAKQTIERK